MAYETTYGSLLADQEDLINKYLQYEDETDEQPIYNIDETEEQEETEQEDYEMYKSFYEQNQAKQDLPESDDDSSFLDFLFEGDNKYQSINYNRLQATNSPFNGYAGNLSSGSLKDTISGLESGGNYKAESPNSSAKGKYQFIWSIHNKDIAKVTGVKTKDEFLNNPQAQEKYFDYWDQTTLTPSANANLDKFKQYYPQATVDDVKKATHFAGRGNLEKALKTGNFTQGIDANNTSIQKYVFKGKMQYGGEDDKRKVQSESTSINRPLKNPASIRSERRNQVTPELSEWLMDSFTKNEYPEVEINLDPNHTMFGDSRSSFSPFSKKVNIIDYTDLEDELSHANQLRNSSALNMSIRTVSDIFKSMINNKTLNPYKAQENNYNEKGTLEHDAHSTMENDVGEKRENFYYGIQDGVWARKNALSGVLSNLKKDEKSDLYIKQLNKKQYGGKLGEIKFKNKNV